MKNHTLRITQLPILSEKKMALTKEYARIHYGLDSHELSCPKMIVVHYTAFASLEESYRFMLPDRLDPSRQDIQRGGDVNVGSHYLIDLNGDIFQLLSDHVMARHTIGFNHVALSIENVGLDCRHLTEEQIEADASLIHQLVKRHPSIEYLIGHHEYCMRTLPHSRLFLEMDESYSFTEKKDPGIVFMDALRKKLAKQYGLSLKD